MNTSIGLAAATPGFNFELVISSVMNVATGIVESDTIPAARAIFSLIFVFHVFHAAKELSFNPSSCRFFNGDFWMRQVLVGALIAGYPFVVVPTVAKMQPSAMMAFATSWYEMFHKEVTTLKTSQDNIRQNDDLARADAVKSAPPESSSGGFWSSLGSLDIVAGVRYGIAWVIAMIAGALITLLILMQGFYALGAVLIVIVVGPICVAFAGHQKTEGIFWSFFKTYVVYGLIHMPVLAIACKFAGVVMGRVAVMAETANLSFGDGGDIVGLLLSTVLGPLSAYTIVKAAPNIIQSLIGGAGIGEGGGGAVVSTAIAAGTALASSGASLVKRGASATMGKIKGSGRGGGGAIS